ncbi:hypothetical protein [Legionella maioricensis]|uniref:Transmembrane protein n=1 Tax=Legionella maioricensis TaxID=2896528 RepID=A0A9X2ICM4_9GAMM|nr:hypothetical protein [Legionella maioricensis]MCL9685580.1 hypothetical protein [Legionella maioricensis]MCL9688917.1 hypothetical protein [Legionella maioricensis]
MSNNFYYDNKYIALGIIGSLIILYGYGQDYPQTYYIFGSFALLATAIHYKLLYFVALEIILAAGHLAILLGVGRYTQMALPVFLCLQLLIFYLMVGKENSIFLLIGIVGIALHSLGFAYNDQWIFFSGSLFIAIYAYHIAYKGRYPAYVWAILNTLFALLALYKIFL